jgi:hypothetical protein
MDSYFFNPPFFLTSFRPSPKLPRHTCGLFASHQCAAAHLRTLRLTPVCRGTPADSTPHTSVPRHTCGLFVAHQFKIAALRCSYLPSVRRLDTSDAAFSPNDRLPSGWLLSMK